MKYTIVTKVSELYMCEHWMRRCINQQLEVLLPIKLTSEWYEYIRLVYYLQKNKDF